MSDIINDKDALQSFDMTDTGSKEPEIKDLLDEKPNANMDKFKAIAKGIFERSNNFSILFFTSDSIPFKTKADALKHTGSLEDKTIVTVNKE